MTTTAQVKGFLHSNGSVGALCHELYLVSGKRTPFGKLNGALSSLNPTDLALVAIRGLFASLSSFSKDQISQVVATNLAPGGADCLYFARHVAIYSGLSISTPCLALHRLCGSGLEVMINACEQIALGKSESVLVAASEVMSRIPLVSFEMRGGFPLGRPQFFDLLWEALKDPSSLAMGETADVVATLGKLSRSQVDEYAFSSQERYQAALQKNFFQEEIVPVEEKGTFEREGLKPRTFKTKVKGIFEKDELPRKTSLEALSSLPTVFGQGELHVTTAGNSSGIVDGAAAGLIASKEWLDKQKISSPLAKILGYAVVGVAPHTMGLGPVPAIKALLEKMNLSVKEIDLFEINEAFSAQCLAVANALEIPLEKLNINGGAIALGHPLAATGLRLATTLAITLKEKNKKLGVAAACIGGGQGVAMLLANTNN